MSVSGSGSGSRSRSGRVSLRRWGWKIFICNAISSKVHRNTEMINLRFSSCPTRGSAELETPNKGIVQQNNHTCIFSPDHGLLKSARKMVVHAIFVVWQKNRCYKLGMSFLFPTPPSELATFLIA